MSGETYNVLQIADAIQDTIRVYSPDKLYGYTLPSALGNFPAVAVEPVGARFDLDMRGATDVWEFLVYVVVNGNNFDTAKKLMGKFTAGRGPNSIREIVFQHRDLGLTNPGDPEVEAFVYGVHGYNGKFPWFNTNHLGAALLVRVYIK